VPGVKIRALATQSLRAGGSRKTVSERFISRAMDCISLLDSSPASKKTASGLPPKM